MTPTTNQSGKETSVCVKEASPRHRQGVTIGVFVDRKAPQHGAQAGFLILLFGRPTVDITYTFVGDGAGLVPTFSFLMCNWRYCFCISIFQLFRVFATCTCSFRARAWNASAPLANVFVSSWTSIFAQRGGLIRSSSASLFLER